jgi:Ca2+-binding RTX toxin-like protein
LLGGNDNDKGVGGAGNDRVQLGAGNDSYDGGAGTDKAFFVGSSAPVTADLVAGTATGEGSDTLAGIEYLTGSSFGDTLSGNDSPNLIRGGDGNDDLFGLGGGDYLEGGAGDDNLDGGAGSDNCVQGPRLGLGRRLPVSGATCAGAGRSR